MKEAMHLRWLRSPSIWGRWVILLLQSGFHPSKMDSSHLLLPVPSSPTASSSTANSLIGAVDHRGNPASRSASGRWTAALFIIGVEIAERFAFYGISSNLITYLTGPLHESAATAAAAINAWSGVASMLPLAGAFVADLYLGRFRTILFASLLYLLGLGLLTLSSMLPSPSHLQRGFFFLALYLIAVAQGGHRPCTQAFGADQFDDKDAEENISRSGFFNWWYCGICLGTAVTILILNYVQDYVSWSLGFGIPFVAMGLALILFLAGAPTYRFYQSQGQTPFRRIRKSFVASLRSRAAPLNVDGILHSKFEKGEPLPTIRNEEEEVEEVEEVGKGVFRLMPIWAACLTYAVVFSQSSTFFTKQGSTLDRRIGSSFRVPPAALQSFISISIAIFLPIYDRILIPVLRRFSGIPTGITQLQRIGTGLVLSLTSMMVAALVEAKRLKTARDYGLLDRPETEIPMSLWWLVPQYVLFGTADVFSMVGLQEFFYDQAPDGFRSLGLALYLSIFGIGSFISSFIIGVIDRVTAMGGGHSWFSDNLNRAHLDYFYWLLAALSSAGLMLYACFAQSYIYKKKQIAAI